MSAVATASAVGRLLSRLDGVKPAGDGKWVARCPCHPDTKPSLGVTVGKDGRLLLFCHAGCKTEDLLAAIGLEMKDLFASPPRRKGKPKPRVVAETAWEIVDTNGTVVAVHHRQDLDDGSKRMWWTRNGRRGLGGIRVADLPLYNLPRLLEAPHGSPCVVCEGERACDSLRERGILAVGTCCGAAVLPSDATLRPLVGHRVLLWSDSDPPGREHMRRIGAALRRLGCQDIRWVEWSNGKPGADAADFDGDDDALRALLDGAVLFDEVADQEGDLASDGDSHPLDALPPDKRKEAEKALAEPTDAANAQLLALAYGDLLRFDHPRDRWLLWRGHWWNEDQDGEVVRLAMDIARYRFHWAWSLPQDQQKSAVGWALRSRQHAHLRATVELAKVLPPIADAGEWDTAPHLLGVANGVVDLRTGELLSGRPDQRITRHIDLPYDRETRCPRWERLVLEVADGREDLAEYLRLAAGYSTTGETREQCLFVLHGPGGTGKSTFLGMLVQILGPYARAASLDAFTDPPGHSESLAQLAGKRLVTALEIREGVRLNEQRLKVLAHGNDRVAASFKYGHEFEFTPICKVWLSFNHKPRIRDDSTGLWRSVRLVPFTRVFSPNQELDLADKLRSESAGILAWLVRAARDWYRDGLPQVSVVKTATEAWRREEDLLQEWLDDCTVEGDRCVAPVADLWRSYLAWTEQEHVPQRERLGRRAFCNRLTARFGPAKGTTIAGRRVRVYEGLGLLHSGATT